MGLQEYYTLTNNCEAKSKLLYIFWSGNKNNKMNMYFLTLKVVGGCKCKQGKSKIHMIPKSTLSKKTLGSKIISLQSHYLYNTIMKQFISQNSHQLYIIVIVLLFILNQYFVL